MLHLTTDLSLDRTIIFIISGPASKLYGPGQMPDPLFIEQFIYDMNSQGVDPYFYFVDPNNTNSQEYYRYSINFNFFSLKIF